MVRASGVFFDPPLDQIPRSRALIRRLRLTPSPLLPPRPQRRAQYRPAQVRSQDRLDSLPADTPYFHAQYRQEYPVVKGQDYLFLETKGRGHYVGTVLAARFRSPAWFGEGDEKFFIDGEAKASIWGTGTEDYFLMAWGLQKASTPYFGVPYFDGRGIGGRTSAYRWHLADPVVFNSGIKVAIEHMGWMSEDENPEYKATSWNEREDDYSSVAFWYQTGESTFAARAPGAAERKLPSLDRLVVQAADMEKKIRSGAASISLRARDDFGNKEILVKPASGVGAWIEIPFEVKAKEPLHLVLEGTAMADGGRWQALLDGVKIGPPLDFHAAQNEDREFPLLDFWPEPGLHALRLGCVGRNAASLGSSCAVESVRLLERRPRVATYAHDKNKDWRKNPRLYQ